MPLAGFKCEAPFKTGRMVCTTEQCLQQCLSPQGGCKPATYVALLLHNMSQYNNAGTVSGSSLKGECDGKAILERILPYNMPISDGHWANFRGSNVHDALEKIATSSCADQFKDWLFEERFYALLWPDDQIDPCPALKDLADEAAATVDAITLTRLPTAEEREDAWCPVFSAIESLKDEGAVVLSGQIDAYDGANGILWDYKTMKFLKAEYGQEKAGPGGDWNLQLRMYKMLLELFDYQVNAVKVSAWDSDKEDQFEVDTRNNLVWVRDFLIPRVRLLARLKAMGTVDEARPYLKVNYLCDGENRSNKTYCPVKDQCPIWHPELYPPKSGVA